MHHLPKKTKLSKVGRELRRLFPQLKAAPESLATFLVGARYYDAFYSRKVRRTVGRVGATRKVAVYLIYPTSGLQKSHLRGLEYLVSKGYAPVVVSNLDLSSSDRDSLVNLCHLCLERPNFGYDFGGYRDGILALESVLVQLDHLLIINDSTWFALPGCQDWLHDAEGLNVDFAAAASNYGVARARVEDMRDFVWDYSTTHKNFHYCSFALLLSNAVLVNPNFHRFWKTFPLTNRKNRTVRRGEIGLSQWIISNGFTHGVTCDVSKLDEALAALDDKRLRQVAEDLIVPEDTRLRQMKHDWLQGKLSREDLILLILHVVARQGSSYALAGYTINECGFPFLKKSPVWLSSEASDITQRLATELPGPYGVEIRSEIEALRSSRTAAIDLPV